MSPLFFLVLGGGGLVLLLSEGGEEQIEVGTGGVEAKSVGRLVEIGLQFGS